MDPEPEAAAQAARPGYQGYEGDAADNLAVFSFVAKHLLRQRRKSQALPAEGQRTAVCLFRGPGGLMCAAGCLVPDSDYDPEWEHDGEVRTGANAISNYFTQRGFDLELLSELQQVHDNTEADEWFGELQSVGEGFGFCLSSTP